MNLTYEDVVKISRAIDILSDPQERNLIAIGLKDCDQDFANILESLTAELMWTGPNASLFTWSTLASSYVIKDIELRVATYRLATWRSYPGTRHAEWTVEVDVSDHINQASEVTERIIAEQAAKMIRLADYASEVPIPSIDDILLHLAK